MSLKSNLDKSRQLGIPHGTACARLRKSVLFSILEKNGWNNCFRCATKIELESELSLDHKRAWLHSKNPKKLFFDLDNVTFSHIFCNTSSKRFGRHVNKTGYRGVSKDKASRKTPFKAAITINSVLKTLGRFKTGKEAALAYNEAATRIFKNKAVLNKV